MFSTFSHHFDQIKKISAFEGGKTFSLSHTKTQWSPGTSKPAQVQQQVGFARPGLWESSLPEDFGSSAHGRPKVWNKHFEV